MDDLRRDVASLRRQVRLISAAALTAGAAFVWASAGGELAAAARALVSGGVLFEGTGGATTQDGANFFWDDANNRLGLGTSAPSSRLDVNGTSRFRRTARFGGSGQEAEVAWSSNVGNGERGVFFRGRSGRSAVLGSNGNIAGVTVSSAGDVVINEGGLPADFRVESDTDPNAFFVHGLTGNVGFGTDTPQAGFDFGGSMIYRAKPGTPLTAHYTHDYAIPDAVYIRISPTITVTADFCRITGIAGGIDGRTIVLHNVGPYNMAIMSDLKAESQGSQPQNRFHGQMGLHGYTLIGVNGMMRLMYDGTLQRWRGAP